MISVKGLFLSVFSSIQQEFDTRFRIALGCCRTKLTLPCPVALYIQIAELRFCSQP